MHSYIYVVAPGTSRAPTYRQFAPPAARGLVVLLPQHGGGIDDYALSALPELLAIFGLATIVGDPVPGGTGYLTHGPSLMSRSWRDG